MPNDAILYIVRSRRDGDGIPIAPGWGCQVNPRPPNRGEACDGCRALQCDRGQGWAAGSSSGLVRSGLALVDEGRRASRGSARAVDWLGCVARPSAAYGSSCGSC
jgi:hypothetical protein